MSFRVLPQTEERLLEALRDFEQRIYNLEHGGAIAGRVSFDDTIVIGSVEVKVVDGSAGAVDLVFTNLNTGATYSISL